MSRVVAVALFAAVVAALATAPIGTASTRPPVGTFSGCPRDARPLPGALPTFELPLRSAVQQFIRTSFRHISKTPGLLVGARVTQVILVRRWLPSGWIKSECGLGVWRNSVAALVYFPRMDKPHNPVGHCNDCAQITFLAALTRGGWTVWGDY